MTGSRPNARCSRVGRAKLRRANRLLRNRIQAARRIDDDEMACRPIPGLYLRKQPMRFTRVTAFVICGSLVAWPDGMFTINHLLDSTWVPR